MVCEGVDKPCAYLCLRDDRRDAASRTEARQGPLTNGNRVRPWSDLRRHTGERREIDEQRDLCLNEVAIKSDLIAITHPNEPGSAWRPGIGRSMLGSVQ